MLQVPSTSRSLGNVKAWRAETLGLHATDGCSNGPTEAVNLVVKKVKRVGHGFRNVTNSRLRLLLYCGRQVADWPDRRTAKPLTTFGGVEPLSVQDTTAPAEALRAIKKAARF